MELAYTRASGSELANQRGGSHNAVSEAIGTQRTAPPWEQGPASV